MIDLDFVWDQVCSDTLDLLEGDDVITMMEAVRIVRDLAVAEVHTFALARLIISARELAP